MQPEDVLFPHDIIRPIQDTFITAVTKAVEEGRHLIAHAPTGLGKTAASIAPALRYALKKDKIIFFVTSRHTQHKIALETLSAIKKRYDLRFNTADIIGKKWLCLQPNVKTLRSGEFADYCKKLREDNLCEYYQNLKEKGKVHPLILRLKEDNPLSTEEIIKRSDEKKLCPYEVAILLAKESRVIIADYYYIFQPKIREGFLKKIERELDDVILIIDEGHNLPSRVKELTSEKITTITIARALQEAKQFSSKDALTIKTIGDILVDLARDCESETYITKDQFLSKIKRLGNPDELIDHLTELGNAVREEKQHSSIGAIASFLALWDGEDSGFTRILEKKIGRDHLISLKYQCLDPATITRNIIGQTHSTILMSGTLTPTSMYKELLGFDRADELTLTSPFPNTNQLNVIIPKTTTKYEVRSPEQYKNIAFHLSRIIEKIPGNSAIFFPSYKLRDDIVSSIVTKKTTFSEEENMTKEEKERLLERFRAYKNKGAALFAVITGNFGEGIDLPGDELKGVVIVGLPLTRPDLETKALIAYFDKKFQKGWDYGYTFPAFTKALQSAGRCIRSETDKGVIIFLDERYTWKNYFQCFPKSWHMHISEDYERLIEEFFKK